MSSKMNRSSDHVFGDGEFGRRAILVLLAVAWLVAGCGGATATPAPASPTAQLSAEEHFMQGNAFFEQGDFAAAEAAFQQAVAQNSDNVGYWHNLGVAQYSLDKLEDARNSFRQGLLVAPDDAELSYLMGAVSIQLNELAEAETYLTRANQLDPDLPEAYFGLGVLYRLLGQPQRAIDAFETFLEIGPGQDPAAVPVAEQELEALRAGQ